MLTINQTYLTPDNIQEIQRLEKTNHTGSFEYLPGAKENDYINLMKNMPVSFLSIKVTAYDQEAAEMQIIETQNTQSYLRVMVQIKNNFLKYEEFEILSISYQEENNKFKDEGLIVNALVRTSDLQPIPKDILNEIIKNISIALKFTLPANINREESLQVKPARNLNSSKSISSNNEIIVDNEGHPQKKVFINYKPDGDNRSFNEQTRDYLNVRTNEQPDVKDRLDQLFEDEEDDEIDFRAFRNERQTSDIQQQNPAIKSSFRTDNYSQEQNRNYDENTKNVNYSRDPVTDPEMSLSERPAYGYKNPNQRVGRHRFDDSVIDDRMHDFNSSLDSDFEKAGFDVTNFSDEGLQDQEYQSQKISDLYHNPNRYSSKPAPLPVTSTPTMSKEHAPMSSPMSQAPRVAERNTERPQQQRQEPRNQQQNQRQQQNERIQGSEQRKNALNSQHKSIGDIGREIVKNRNKIETVNENPEKMSRPYQPPEPEKISQTKNKTKEQSSEIRSSSKTVTVKKNVIKNKISSAPGTGGTFIHSIYNGKYGNDENQNAVYANSNEEAPFLNVIDDYIPNYDINMLEAENPVYEIHEADDFIETTSSKQKIRKEFNTVMSYFTENEATSVRRVLNGEIEVEDFMTDVRLYLDKYSHIPEEDRAMFEEKIKNAFFSYYVLTPAIFDPDISDIRVLAPDNINVKVNGSHYTASDLKFINEADFNRFINGLIIKNRIRVNSPILVFTDKDFNDEYILRFNLCLGHINSTEAPYLHIRKVPKDKLTLQKLIDKKMLSTKVAKYLLDKVATSRGLVFAGPSASGKTTLMNALVDYVPKDKSILCIQESEEMFSKVHPNAYFQHMLKDAHGDIMIGLSELGKNGLLCDSGYFIIGECKGSEVRDLLRASNTGHKCWCSVHSQSSMETIPRLADYVKYGSDYSFKEAVRMLKDLEVIVYIENFKIKEITEIAGYDEDNEKIIYRPVYRNPELF